MIRRTPIIAEAGVNHNGDLNIAKQLIDSVVEAGADVIKFQTFLADQIATKAAEQATYQKSDGEIGKSDRNAKTNRVELKSTSRTTEYCKQGKIEFYQQLLPNKHQAPKIYRNTEMKIPHRDNQFTVSAR